jgi:hypothetical protein
MNNTSQTSPSTNQVDANNPQNPTAPVPAPSSVPQAPSAQNPPTVVPSAQPNQTQTNPSASSAQPQQQQPNQPSLHARIFDKILRGMTGGPVRIVGPNGDIQEVPQSRTTMGKSIVAAALAGLMTPSHYRETPYGPVRDYSADMAGAAQAGQNAYAKPQQQAQEQSNLQQTRKLFTLQNNVKLVQQAAAMAHQQHAVLDNVVKTNQDKFANPLTEWDKQRPAGEDSIFAGKGMTHDEVLNSGHNLTDNNVYIDGIVEKPNQFGVLEPQPTYSVIRSTNKDGSPISLKLPQEVTDELGKFNKGYQQAYTATGGNVVVPINNYMDAVHTYHTLNSVEDFLADAQKRINPGGSPIDLAAAYKKNPTATWPAIQATELALASGNNNEAAGGSVDNMIRLIRAKGGSQLLNLLGPSDVVDKWAEDQQNERLRKQTLAKEGGIGEKAPATPEQNAAYLSALNKLPADQQGDFVKPPKGGWTQAQLEKEQNRLDARFDTNTRAAQQAGDPTELAKTVKNVIGSGDLTAAKNMFTARSNVRETYNNLAQDQARALGLDPTHFNIEAQQAKADAFKTYSAAGKVGQQLNAFKTFGEHISGAKDANDAWSRSGSPLFNKSISWLAENATNDQNYQRFRASVIAPAKEYMNFLNANRAEHSEDIRAMESVLDSKSATPQTVYTALQTWAKTADDRAKALGETYRDTVGTTFPGLVSKATVDSLAKLGVKSQAAPLSGTLPRAQSWVANLQPQTLNPKQPADKAIMQRFFEAAGKDQEKALEMAHEHGYTF